MATRQKSSCSEQFPWFISEELKRRFLKPIPPNNLNVIELSLVEIWDRRMEILDKISVVVPKH
jgi:hypothetical protein